MWLAAGSREEWKVRETTFFCPLNKMIFFADPSVSFTVLQVFWLSALNTFVFFILTQRKMVGLLSSTELLKTTSPVTQGILSSLILLMYQQYDTRDFFIAYNHILKRRSASFFTYTCSLTWDTCLLEDRLGVSPLHGRLPFWVVLRNEKGTNDATLHIF